MNTLTPPEAAFSEAIRLLETGALAPAEAALERLLTTLPKHAAARFLLGLCRFRQGRADTGLQTMQEALAQAPTMPLGHLELGRCLIQVGRPADALICMDDAIAVAPAFANAHFERGNLLQRLGRADESVAAYDMVITLEPQRAAAHHRRGNALHRSGRLDAALAAYDAAITFQPELADAHADRGLLLQSLGRADEALASYDHAILIDRGLAAAHYNHGNLLHDLKRLDESLAAYDRALALMPVAASAHNNRGLVLRELGRIDEALAAFDRALEIDPDFAGAHANRGGIFLQRQDFVAALTALGNALRLDGTEEYALGDWLHVKMNLCDWVDLEPALATLRARIEVGERVTYPFPALSLPTTPAQQLAIARSFVAHRFPARPLRPSGPKRRDAADRIRLAYFSSDLRNHPVAYLMAGVFEHHDRSLFEILAISSGPSPDHPMRRRMESAFDRFIDVGDRPDDEVAAQARDLDIDIAIDLNGLTGDSRIGVFARRPAPIQVAYIGFPGTSGADYIDYAIADRISVPPEQRAHFSEKIVYLPNCFQANDSTKLIADRPLSRADFGLPEAGFVFCCFNNTYKITPGIFDIWIRLLHGIDDSVLWLAPTSNEATHNLRKEAERRGADPDRLVFARRVPLADFLAQLRLADLFVDTFAYNAGATASDALWAGLPVLTCAGDSFARRMGASLLHAIGLPEMITDSPAAYESLALELAHSPQHMATVREKLRINRDAYPLFDTAGFTRDLEAAYAAMWARQRAGLAPEHIVVTGKGDAAGK